MQAGCCRSDRRFESRADHVHQRGAHGLGVLALGASLIAMGNHKFMFSYLVAFMFTLSIALGALFFVLVQHVARAGWSIVVRRIAENMSKIEGVPIVTGFLGRDPDGNIVEAPLNSTCADVAAQIGPGLAKAAIACYWNDWR